MLQEDNVSSSNRVALTRADDVDVHWGGCSSRCRLQGKHSGDNVNDDDNAG